MELTPSVRQQAGDNLREFGYKVTQELVEETINAILAAPDKPAPNGIIGMMLKKMLDDAETASAPPHAWASLRGGERGGRHRD